MLLEQSSRNKFHFLVNGDIKPNPSLIIIPNQRRETVLCVCLCECGRVEWRTASGAAYGGERPGATAQVPLIERPWGRLVEGQGQPWNIHRRLPPAAAQTHSLAPWPPPTTHYATPPPIQMIIAASPLRNNAHYSKSRWGCDRHCFG